MKGLVVALVVAVALAVRLAIWRRRRRPDRPALAARRLWRGFDASLGDVGLVASREIRERVRGRIFRVGTLLMVLGVAAAVVIPALVGGSGPAFQKVGVLGTVPQAARQAVLAAGQASHERIRFVPEASLGGAKAHLRSGTTDLALVSGDEILVDQPLDATRARANPTLVRAAAAYLGALQAYRQAGLSPGQVAVLGSATPATVRSIAPSPKSPARATSIIGLVLLFFMLTQYCTWILIGVMQEKSSRVVEVLLATVRPIQLLGGKVLGIGLVALGQAALVVSVALVLGAAVGSDLLSGAAPIALLAELLWLVLGYAFYCWVYAAAGSMAERQDQVQTLALPLSLPILLGYVFSITVASTGDTSPFFWVLAFLPPTAPFCMSVLVGLHQATWWEFAASALLSVIATGGVAVFAAGIYRRAVLRTGARVRLSDVLGRRAARQSS